MKIYKYVSFISLSIMLVLLFQNIQMRSFLKIASNIADESVELNSSRLEYILNHFANEVSDTAKMFIQCANEVRKNDYISDEQKYMFQECASALFCSDYEKSALHWTLKKSHWFPHRYLVLSLLENDIINYEMEFFISDHTFVHNGGHVTIVSSKDTLKYGELYEANMKFVLEDTCTYGMYLVSEDNIWNEKIIENAKIDTIKDGHYEVVAQKKGNNTIYGFYRIESFYKTSYYQFQLNYYVK